MKHFGNSYFSYLYEIKLLLGDESRKIPLLILLFLSNSVLDLIGIGLIAPYISLIVDPDFIKNSYVIFFLDWTGYNTIYEDPIVFISFVIIVIFLLKTSSVIYVNYRILNFCNEQQVRISSGLMHSFQDIPYAEYCDRNSAEYVYYISSLSSQFSSGALQSILKILSEGVVLLVIVLILALQSPSMLALIVFLLSFVGYIYDRYSKERMQRYGKEINKLVTSSVKSIYESFDGWKEIKILGKENYFFKIVHGSIKRSTFLSLKKQLISLSIRYIFEFVIIACIMVWVIFHLYYNAEIVSIIPTLGLFGIASIRLIPSLSQISTGLSSIRHYRNSVHLLYKDIFRVNANPDHDVSNNNMNVNHIEDTSFVFKSIKLNGISYKYPNASYPIINNLSLSVKSGDSIGIIGESGSGKTTILDIMLGLLVPQNGDVRVNGTPLRDVIDKWRSRVAYLPQEIFLIDDTLRKNIALGVDCIDNNKVIESIKRAKLEVLVNDLSLGMDTIIGEKGVRLSGGQRQRVALARAFYHSRDVLILDESTSAMDSETEKEIVEEIRRLKDNNTIIVIAHRLTTLQYCDRVLRIEGGVIAEDGDYNSIVKKS